jgi:hypothetical protein
MYNKDKLIITITVLSSIKVRQNTDKAHRVAGLFVKEQVMDHLSDSGVGGGSSGEYTASA